MDGVEGGAGAVPTPLRRFEGHGAVAVRSLAEGTAAQIIHICGRVTIQVAESVPMSLHGMIAEHCYTRHRLACRAASCRVARAFAPIMSVEVIGAASA